MPDGLLGAPLVRVGSSRGAAALPSKPGLIVLLIADAGGLALEVAEVEEVGAADDAGKSRATGRAHSNPPKVSDRVV